MAILTTTRDQIRVGTAARRVGGYDELIRLDREKRAAGKIAVLKRRPDGRLCYVRAEPLENAPEDAPRPPPASQGSDLAWRGMVLRLLARWIGRGAYQVIRS